MLKFFSFFFTSTLWIAVCMAEAGVWHATDDKTGATSFFLYFEGEESRVFNADWIEVTSGFKLEEDRFQFKAPFKTYGIKIAGHLRDGKMSGTWQIPHPQFPMQGTWTSELLFHAKDWKPWGFLSSKSQVVDLVGAIGRGKPFKDDVAFLKFWSDEIEPAFFTLLSHSLYSNGESGYDPDLRRSRPKEVFALIQSEDGNLWKRDEDFSHQISGILSDLQKQYPWMKPKSPICNVLSLGYFDFRLTKVGTTSLLLFGADWMAQNVKEKEKRRLLAEGLICSFHSAYLGLPAQLATEFFYRSVANNLLEKAEPFRLRSSLSADVETSESVGVKEQLWGDMLVPSILFFPTYLKGNKRHATYQVSFEFGDSLAINRKPIDLFRVTEKEMREALGGFFTSAKKENPDKKAESGR